MRISDWSSDVCSSDLACGGGEAACRCDRRPGGRGPGTPALTARPARGRAERRDGERILARRGQAPPRRASGGAGQAPRDRGGPSAAARRDRFGGQGRARRGDRAVTGQRSEEQTSELQSLMRISYDVYGLKKKKTT